MRRQELEDRLHFFQNELTWLNLKILLLRKLREFPWKTLRLEYMYLTFINTIYKGLFEYSIVIIRRVYFDNRKDVMTLKKFAERELNSYPQELKNIDIQLENYGEKINNLRNNRFGHLKKSLLIDDINYYNLTFEEVKYSSDLLSKYLNKIGDKIDGRNIRTRPIEFDPIFGDEINEFDKFLDHIAKASEMINLYEENKDLWEAQERNWNKNGKRENDLRIINTYRKKLYGLNEIK